MTLYVLRSLSMQKGPRPNLSLLPRLSLVVWEPVEGHRFIICTGRWCREEEVDKERAEDAGTQRKLWISGLLRWLCLQDLLITPAWAQLSLSPLSPPQSQRFVELLSYPHTAQTKVLFDVPPGSRSQPPSYIKIILLPSSCLSPGPRQTSNTLRHILTQWFQMLFDPLSKVTKHHLK